MMRISTSQLFQQSLATMLEQQSALSRTQNEVSTGQRINVASDDPTGAAQIVSLDHILAGNTQFQSNINAASTRLSSESDTLNAVRNVLDSVNDLGLQGLDGSLTDDNRKDMATQLTQLRDQLLQLANTTDQNGDALFAGTSNTRTPFQLNADGSPTYLGNGQQTLTAIGPQLSVANTDPGNALFLDIPAGNGDFVARAGSGNSGELVVGDNSVTDTQAWQAATANGPVDYTIQFDDAGNWTVTQADGTALVDASGNPVSGSYSDGDTISFNGLTLHLSGTPADGDTVEVKSGTQQDIFTTLSNMIDSLDSGDDGATLSNQINRELESVKQASAQISHAQVDAGTRLSTLTQKESAYSDLAVTYKTALNNVQNVDPAEAISNLSLQSTALQASQQVFAKVQQLSLFNFIK